MNNNIEDLKYPIGPFQMPELMGKEEIENWILSIQQFPEKLKAEVQGLSEADLTKTYRPDGWTIMQLVHHLADSHMNCFVRFKLALTEETPTIKSYSDDLWANLIDAKSFSIDSSIKILEGMHERWVYLLNSLSAADFDRQVRHPDTDSLVPLKVYLAIYAWHGNHHIAHIQHAKK